MKVGDLVTLSAYGKKVQRTSWVQSGDIGIIKRISRSGWDQYIVHWNKSTWHLHSWVHERSFYRKDLKFVKSRKGIT